MSVPFKVKALYEYSSEYDDDLQFAAGSVITVTDIEDDDWYSGTFNGKAGLFPKNFVELIKNDEVSSSAKTLPSPNVVASVTAHAPPVPSTDPITSVAKSEETIDKEEDHVALSSKPESKSVAASGETKEPGVTAHDLEIDDLIRKNSTALPEQFDEAASVFGGNMKHVECPASPLQPPVPVPSAASPKEEKQEPLSPKKSEGPPPLPRVPMPGSLSSHRDDPHAIKKQFIGAGKSSYVPQVKPRDNSSVVHGFNDVSEASNIVRETDETPQEESNEPKMSLKERIAMLQKRQQEEAEREAAARKKKEDRKKKADEEKRAKAAHATTESASVPGTSATEDESHHKLSEEPTMGHTSSGQPKALNSQISGTSLLSEDHQHSEAMVSEKDVSGLEKDAETEVAEIESQSDKDEDDDDEEEEGAEGEEQEDEDDEDLRRRRLVERMAKISGGRNMFGMMGMPNPFGSAPTPATSEVPKSKKKSKSSETHQAPAASVSGPDSQTTPAERVSKVGIPIPGIGFGDKTKPTRENEKVAKTEESEQPFVGEEEDEPSEDPDADQYEAEDAHTSPEREILKEREQKIAPEKLIQTQDRAPSPPLDISHPEIKKTVEQQSMSIVKENAHDVSGTGYEADADVSDIGASQVQEDSHTDDVTKDVIEVPGSLPSVPAKPVIAPPPPMDRSKMDFSSAPAIPTPPVKLPSISLDSKTKTSPPSLPSQDAPSSPPFDDPLAELPPSQAPPVPSQMVPPTTTADTLERDIPEPPVHHPPPSAPPAPPVPRAVPSVGASEEHVAPPRVKAPPPPPPVPTEPPIPHSSVQADFVDVPEKADEDTSEDELQVVDAQPMAHVGRSHTYSATEHSQSPQFMPPTLVSKSNTESLQRDSAESPRKSIEIRRSSSLRDGRSMEQDQAILQSGEVKAELENLGETSGWWIKSEIPDSLSNNLGIDYDFEVDENRIKKRNGREVVYKDYYVLFHDLSQFSFEIQYQADDPRQSASITTFDIKGRPKVRVDVLHTYSSNFGQVVADFGESVIGSKLATGVVEEAIQRLTSKQANVLRPIGEKGFGVAVYINYNREVNKIDEVKPGDILCMKDARFSNHKGLGGLTSKSITVGEGNDLYSAVIIGYDPKKDKVKVAESGKGGVVKREGYRLGELKSGKITVFRIVSRDSVGW